MPLILSNMVLKKYKELFVNMERGRTERSSDHRFCLLFSIANILCWLVLLTHVKFEAQAVNISYGREDELQPDNNGGQMENKWKRGDHADINADRRPPCHADLETVVKRMILLVTELDCDV